MQQTIFTSTFYTCLPNKEGGGSGGWDCKTTLSNKKGMLEYSSHIVRCADNLKILTQLNVTRGSPPLWN